MFHECSETGMYVDLRQFPVFTAIIKLPADADAFVKQSAKQFCVGICTIIDHECILNKLLFSTCNQILCVNPHVNVCNFINTKMENTILLIFWLSESIRLPHTIPSFWKLLTRFCWEHCHASLWRSILVVSYPQGPLIGQNWFNIWAVSPACSEPSHHHYLFGWCTPVELVTTLRLCPALHPFCTSCALQGWIGGLHSCFVPLGSPPTDWESFVQRILSPMKKHTIPVCWTNLEIFSESDWDTLFQFGSTCSNEIIYKKWKIPVTDFPAAGLPEMGSSNFLLVRTCSPGDSTPQRQCAWLLSTYLEKSEEQKEMLGTKVDEEKENEVDGEVEERVTPRAHETWRWPWNGMRDKLDPLELFPNLWPWSLPFWFRILELKEGPMYIQWNLDWLHFLSRDARMCKTQCLRSNMTGILCTASLDPSRTIQTALHCPRPEQFSLSSYWTGCWLCFVVDRVEEHVGEGGSRSSWQIHDHENSEFVSQQNAATQVRGNHNPPLVTCVTADNGLPRFIMIWVWIWLAWQGTFELLNNLSIQP